MQQNRITVQHSARKTRDIHARTLKFTLKWKKIVRFLWKVAVDRSYLDQGPNGFAKNVAGATSKHFAMCKYSRCSV